MVCASYKPLRHPIFETSSWYAVCKPLCHSVFPYFVFACVFCALSETTSKNWRLLLESNQNVSFAVGFPGFRLDWSVHVHEVSDCSARL